MTRNGTKRRGDAEARKAIALPDLLSGMSLREVARRHEVSDATVRRWMAEPEIRAQLAAMKDEAFAELQRIQHRAVVGIEELFDAEDDNVKLKSFLAVLDRTGLPKTDRHEVEDVTAPKTDDEALAILEKHAVRLPDEMRRKLAARLLGEVSEEADDGDE